MLFVTDTFLVFFLVVFVVFWALPVRFRIPFLTASSLFFYGSWSILFTLHFVLVIAVNYTVMEIWRIHQKKWIFVLLQIANVLNIALFKYYYFMADILGAILGIKVWTTPHLLDSHRALGQEIFLPLAISFYTFQIMAYGFDIYRGTYTRKHTFREVLLFKAFFPQLIAGPIMRSDELLPQIADYNKDKSLQSPDFGRMKKGLWLILIGVIKKLLVADLLLAVLAPIFSAPSESISAMAPGVLWVTMFCGFAFLYADFSAYSDLARGFGFMLGFTIPINFRAPLLAHSVSEFWRRWHLTFAHWIRDYIYIPLGGSKTVEWRIYFNLIFTFVIGGIWHGASYTFLLWGLWMGVVIALESYTARRGIPEWPKSLWGRGLKIAVSWTAIMISCSLFFAPSAEKLGADSSFASIVWVFSVIGQMFNLVDVFTLSGSNPIAKPGIVLSSILVLGLFNWFEQTPRHFTWLRKYENVLLPVLGFIAVIAITQFAGGKTDFFYFQF